jgi:bacteriocin-like protein
MASKARPRQTQKKPAAPPDKLVEIEGDKPELSEEELRKVTGGLIGLLDKMK